MQIRVDSIGICLCMYVCMHCAVAQLSSVSNCHPVDIITLYCRLDPV